MDTIIVEDIDDGINREGASPSPRTEPVQHLSLASRFNIDTPTREENEKLQTIWSFAAEQAQTHDLQEILWSVIHLEQVLGAPKLGETRLDKVYKYIRLKRQEAQIQKELKDVSLGSRL